MYLPIDSIFREQGDAASVFGFDSEEAGLASEDSESAQDLTRVSVEHVHLVQVVVVCCLLRDYQCATQHVH